MKAVILAGGEGRRLRPITETMPKPLVPVNGIPLITDILRRLKSFGIVEAAITTGYRGEQIEAYLAERSEGVSLSFFREDTPLGTAGSVKQAEAWIGDEDFLVISGDCFCRIPLDEAIRQKKESGCEALLILSRVKNPGEYGVVCLDDEGIIVGFSEKPSLSGTYTNTVNTGIYLLSPSVLKRIPEKYSYDFGRDLFPTMLSEGALMRGFVSPGEWWDVGDPESYLEVNMRETGGKSIIGSSTVSPTATVIRSVIMDGATVSDGCRIENAVLCQGVVLDKNVTVSRGCIIGAESHIGRGVMLTGGTRLPSGSRVPEGMILRSVSTLGGMTSASELLGENGIICPMRRFTPSLSVKIGAALSLSCDRGKIIMAHDGTVDACQVLAGVLRGVRAGGGEIIQLGEGFEAMTSAAGVLLHASLSLFFGKRGDKISIAVFDSCGLYPKREWERSLLAALSGDSPFGTTLSSQITDLNFDETHYLPMMVAGINRLDGFPFHIDRDNFASRVLANALLSLGAVVRPFGIGFSVSDDGFRVCCEERGGFGSYTLDDWHGKALLIKHSTAEQLPLPRSAPSILFDLSAGRARPYSHCPSGNAEDMVRIETMKHPELIHGCRAGIEIAAIRRASGRDLRELGERLPRFASTTEEIKLPPEHRLSILGFLGQPAGDGVRAEYARGTVRITATPYGYRLSAEAASGEYAEEILSLSKREIEKRLKDAEGAK